MRRQNLMHQSRLRKNHGVYKNVEKHFIDDHHENKEIERESDQYPNNSEQCFNQAFEKNETESSLESQEIELETGICQHDTLQWGLSQFSTRKLHKNSGEIMYNPSYLSKLSANRLFQELLNVLEWKSMPITMFGKQIMQPRQICWIADSDVVYTYSKLELVPEPWPQCLLSLKSRLESELKGLLYHSLNDLNPDPKLKSKGHETESNENMHHKKLVFNGCLCNLYRDGKDYMGYHSDDEPELGVEPIIVSVSLGSERRFLLKPKKRFSESSKEMSTHRQFSQVIEYNLSNGSVLIMKGKTQEYWKHSIPKTSKKVGQRINLTFRYIRSDFQL